MGELKMKRVLLVFTLLLLLTGSALPSQAPEISDEYSKAELKQLVAQAQEMLAAGQPLNAQQKQILGELHALPGGNDPVINRAGGPNSFGYIFRDSQEENGPAYDWVDITETGTEVTDLLTDDNDAGPFDIGFDFPYYGETKDEFYVQSNGALAFESFWLSWVVRPLPRIWYPAFIAGYWDDLDIRDGGEVYYESTVFQGQNALVVSYIIDEFYWQDGWITFQMILFENGDILFQYQDYDDVLALDESIIGIQNDWGTDALQYAAFGDPNTIEREFAVKYYYGEPTPETDHLYHTGWTLMSLPFEPANPDPAVVLGEHIESIWQLIGFDPGTGYWPLYPPLDPEDPDMMEVGAGYWLALAHDDDVEISVDGDLVTGPYTYELASNWNMLGYPFTVGSDLWDWSFSHDGTSYSARQAAEAGLIVPILHVAAPEFDEWGYWNHFGATTHIEPWYGFWIMALEEGISMTIGDPAAAGGTGGGNELDEKPETDWELPLVLEAGEQFCGSVVLGSAMDASGDYDVFYDYPQAPPLPEPAPASVFFQREGWLPQMGERFAYDIHGPVVDVEHSWTFTVDGEGEVNLSWPWFAEVAPHGYAFELQHNTGEGTPIDMGDQSSYSFTIDDDEESFTVTVSNSTTDVAEESGLPSEFSLQPAYPNPFNPSTTIAYELPRNSRVELVVHDVMGRRVAELFTGARQAGRHQATWQAADHASGIYFVTLQADGFHATQKLMLLK